MAGCRRAAVPTCRRADVPTCRSVRAVARGQELRQAAACRISPKRPANRLGRDEVIRLRRALRAVLREATAWGSTVPLHWLN